MTVKLPYLPHAFSLRRKSSDVEAFNKIFAGLDYDFMLPASAKLIVDCGANVGYASLFFLSKYPEAKIICIEPEAETFTMLKKNMAPYKNVHCIQKAIWHSKTELIINNDYNVDVWGSVFVVKDDLSQQGSKVQATSIAEVLEGTGETRIDILKIDIEGAELELFSKNYHTWLPVSKRLYIELHDWVRKGCGTSMFKATTQFNFSYYARGENTICINEDLQD